MAANDFGSTRRDPQVEPRFASFAFPAAIVLKKQHDIGKLEALRVTRTAFHTP
jgi:hypothetical protein